MIVDFHTKQRFYWRTFLLQLEFYIFFSCLSYGLLLTLLFYFFYQLSNLKELTVQSNFSCKYMAHIVTAIKTKQFTFIVKKSPCFCHSGIIDQKYAIKRSEYASAVNLFVLLLVLQTTTFRSSLRPKITPIFHSKGTVQNRTRTQRVRCGTYAKHTPRGRLGYSNGDREDKQPGFQFGKNNCICCTGICEQTRSLLPQRIKANLTNSWEKITL